MFPQASVAVQVTVVVPTGNDDGALFDKVTVPQPSVVVGVSRFTGKARHTPGSTFW